MSQHMEMLRRANVIRLGRIQIKREIRDGECTAIDILEGEHFVCNNMTILELLCSQKYWGRTRSLKFLHIFTPHTGESRKLKSLTNRERSVLVKGLEEWYG